MKFFSYISRSNISYSNQITLTRLLGSVTVLPVLVIYILPYNNWLANSFVAIAFAGLAFTDFLDGYIARKYKEVSLIGEILDPIADKFLLFAGLVSLLAIQKISFWWVFILLGREIFIMTLRHIAAEYYCSIPVIVIAKYKTTMQLLSLFFIILNPYMYESILKHPYWNGTTYGMLVLATGLSILSAYYYAQFFIDRMKCYLKTGD